jgi:hypothetical protein
MKKIGYDQLHLDQLKVVDDKKRCCLRVNAVITKVGVYPYPDGRAFKSRMELIKATPTARNAKITIMDHPDSMVVMSQSQIYGTVEKPFFERDRIRATLNFDKYVTPTRFLTDVRKGDLKDVSIGFYYQPDWTPGQWNGQSYDYVMRDIVIDHVAAGVTKGRCSYPTCGIGVDGVGVDTLMRRIALDPFGEYKSFEDCVSKNQDKTNPEAYCASLEKKITGKWPAEDKLQHKGGKKGLSEDKDAGETTKSEYDECVAARIAEGWDEGAAKDYCTAYTTPSDEPAVPPATKPEDTGTTGGAQEQHAPETPEGPKETSEVFLKCVRERMAEGAAREEAEKVCRGTEEHKGDQEVEKTELERCIENKVDEGMGAEEAREWCLADQAGEHAPAADMIEHSQKLLKLREQRNIERQRSSRRHPL